jgi:SAM-dependent methyltransferase
MCAQEPRATASELAYAYLERGDPTGWFEPLYARADISGTGVPWIKLAPNPALAGWLAEGRVQGAGRQALVVGCGMGDDAEELARRGFEVTAFDISPSAIRLCHERFPASPVTYLNADLFAPPGGWQGRFDLVVEVITVQALPPILQETALARIVAFVAPGGQLFVFTNAREPHLTPQGPPWAISRDTLAVLDRAGFTALWTRETPRGVSPPTWPVSGVFERRNGQRPPPVHIPPDR